MYTLWILDLYTETDCAFVNVMACWLIADKPYMKLIIIYIDE